ncbi:unnamed protein product [Moneuplotes crassus]|uniref:Uncharacterized protein n=1 Tax=Euplotes crassus TaxID=5936 RepID=A0AAD1Y6P6_EUPCR|nr:unnamed protein product [Moneuplotes crassus]
MCCLHSSPYFLPFFLVLSDFFTCIDLFFKGSLESRFYELNQVFGSPVIMLFAFAFEFLNESHSARKVSLTLFASIAGLNYDSG